MSLLELIGVLVRSVLLLQSALVRFSVSQDDQNVLHAGPCSLQMATTVALSLNLFLLVPGLTLVDAR